ncbi:MAG: DNA polymerase III subunit gamma/tau [Fibrobacterales bacterium]
MAYVAMARKWRPNNFNELTGQGHIALTIENAIQNDTVSHAYLFTGTRGVGKTSSARILAKTLNCKNLVDLTPCDSCESCTSITKSASIDVVELDGASNNSVDDVRDLIEQVKYAPMHGKYKIFIVDEVHMLTKNAFNALLKTLEEPPEHVIFIFATTEVNKVPQTILSRIQRFDFKRISEKEIIDRLKFISEKETITYSEDALTLIARKGDGSMRDAITLFDQVYSLSGNDMTTETTQRILGVTSDSQYFELMRAVINHDQLGCYTVISNFYEEGIEVEEFLNGFLLFIRNLVYTKISNLSFDQIGVSEETHTELKEIANELEHGDLLRYSKLIYDIQSEVKQSPHPRITIEMGIARLAYIDRVANIRQIISKISTAAPGEVKKKL